MEDIYVVRSCLPPEEEFIEEIKSIWQTRWLTNMGEKHKKLQKQLETFLDVPEVSLFSNGHMALELAIQALNLTGEVITTPFTFASTTHAIVRNGLTPVFCDINPVDYTIDVDKIEELITEKTSAIIPVHVYGSVCDVEKIEEIARKYHLKVIYDAAHAFGVKYKGKGIGNYGDASMMSFHATKVFHTIEGGAVCFSDHQYGIELYKLKNFGIKGPEEVDGVGANAKMNEFEAAMGICNLRYVEEQIEARRQRTDYYNELLGNIKGIKLLAKQKDVESNYAYYPIVIDEEIFGFTRNEVFEELEKHGVHARKYFYPLTSTYECFHGNYDAKQTPIALWIAERVMTLPLYPELPIEQVQRICNIILGMQQDKN